MIVNFQCFHLNVLVQCEKKKIKCQQVLKMLLHYDMEKYGG